MPSAIECHALTRDFGNVRALDHLTFSVPEGSVFAFLGPNGAGKTTTLHLLLGILEPTSGSSRVLGFDPGTDAETVRRHSGALLEHSGLYERLSAEDNLRFYARIARLEREEADARIAEVLQRFGLFERRADPVVQWSRGMKQKLAIARALLAKPSLLFLDEPTAGLDPEATVALRRDIVSLETTVFLTTHNLADVEKMATHVAVIRKGQLLDSGTVPELRSRAMRTRVTIRMQDRDPLSLELEEGESAAPIVTRLVHEGAQVEEVRREEPSIEDVFLHLMMSGVPTLEGGSPPSLESGSKLPHSKATPLFRDIAAVARKELAEVTASDSRRTRRINLVAGIVLLAVVAGFSAYIGGKFIHSPAILAASIIAIMTILATVADSIAGERERHTLETLLASAAPDEALLLGKISANVLYGWGVMLAIVATVLLGANLTNFPILYRPSALLGTLVLTPLMLVLFVTAGVLVSLHAATVREAQIRLSVLLFGIFIPLVAVRPFIPRALRERAFEALRTESGLTRSILVQIGVLLVVNLVLLVLALARFRRSRLIAGR